MELAVERYGADGPLLLLVHGVGANGAVWIPLLERLRRRWRGRILVPDLRGHGRSPHATTYGLGQHAADIAELFEDVDDVYVAGHSMGGAIALVLASRWFGRSITGTLAFSLKPAFDANELAKAREVARTPPRRFASREEALERYARVAGLAGLVALDAPLVAAGIVERDGAWQLAADAATLLAAGPDLGPMFAAARGRLIVATGERDPIAPATALQAHAPNLRVVARAGHNLHVEDPDAVAALIAELAA